MKFPAGTSNRSIPSIGETWETVFAGEAVMDGVCDVINVGVMDGVREISNVVVISSQGVSEGVGTVRVIVGVSVDNEVPVLEFFQ